MTDTLTDRAPTAAAEITTAAIDSFDACPDPRLREIMRSLVWHLHAFASEVKLTEAEWTTAIDILTATGHITTDKRSGVHPVVRHARPVDAGRRHGPP